MPETSQLLPSRFQRKLMQVELSVNMQQLTTSSSLFQNKGSFLWSCIKKYETRIAVNFLKRIQEAFFSRYDHVKRNNAVGHSLKDFKPTLQEWMAKFSNKQEVDKLSNLRKELSELEEQALRNMNKVIDRGEKIEVLVKKAEVLSDQSLDMRNTSRKVKNKMWWKNKKVMIGIILVIVAVIAVVIIIANI